MNAIKKLILKRLAYNSVNGKTEIALEFKALLDDIERHEKSIEENEGWLPTGSLGNWHSN